MPTSIVKHDGRNELEELREEVKDLRKHLMMIAMQVSYHKMVEEKLNNLELKHALVDLERMIKDAMDTETALARLR